MDESEKMTALKKAYADIILNTAKEAAARVMASERSAQALQHDLKETKEEALKLLLRMKQMMDSKISEAEMRSQIQQRRIEELEAQLQEAEDIVGNLRAELSEAQSELERLEKNQWAPMKENCPVDGAAHLEEAELQENGLMGVGFTSRSLQAEDAEVVTTLEAKTSVSNAAIDANSNLDIHLRDYCRVGSPDFASIVVRSKEPELYKNGCTQRIRAFERNLLNGHLSLSEELCDLKNGKLVKEDKEDKKIRRAGVGCTVEENLAEGKGVRAGTNGFKVKSCRKGKPTRRGCKGKAHNLKTVIVPDKETLGGADLSGCKSSLAVSSIKFLETSHVKETINGHSISDVRTQSDALVMSSASRSAPVTRSEADKDSVIDEDMEVVNSLVMFSQESVSGKAIGVFSSQTELEEQNGALVDSNTKISDASNSVADQDTEERLLKYTFQRKRKKASVSVDYDNVMHEDSTLMRRTGKKQFTTLEAKKSNSIVESSRDSRRMAQVARQLISLSEKKWWQ
ncbi:hypothetical protein Dimus_004818 [Dionaea muscipula]